MIKRSPDAGPPDGQEVGAPPWRPVLIGLAAASAVALTVVVALLLALQDLPSGIQPPAPVVQPSVQPALQFTPFTPVLGPTGTPSPTLPAATATIPAPLAPTFTPASGVPPTVTTAASPTPLPSPTPFVATLPPLPQTCTPPFGWVGYTVQVGDTLNELAYRYRIDVSLLMQANCLNNQVVYPGQVIFLPPVVFTPTPLPPPPCGPPPGWVQYVVQPGDTLNSLAARTNTTIYAIAQASCLTRNVIRVGQVVWLPFLPQPPVRTPTLPPTATYTPYPYPTPTSTLAPTPSNTPAATFTATSQPPTATHTPLPTATHTPTLQPTETATLTPRLTNTPVPFLTPTPGP